MNRQMSVAAGSLALCLASVAPGYAIPFSGFDWTLNGAASIGARLLLAPASGSQRGSAFVTTPFAIDGSTSFTVAFDYEIAGGSGADGLVFMLQNSPFGAATLGGVGGGMGYFGVSPSIAVEFDTWFNAGVDPPCSLGPGHMGVDEGGSLISAASTCTNVRGDHSVVVTYNGLTNLLSVSLDGSAPLNRTFDLTSLGTSAFLGFSAATGGATDNHWIDSVSITGLAAVPEPGPLAMLGGGLLCAAALSRRRGRR